MMDTLPDADTMYRALCDKDSRFEGIFVVGVRTTGIFCRPTCTARKPKRENVDFYASTREALLAGYRPCKLCEPLGQPGQAPPWLQPILDEAAADPGLRLPNAALRARGVDPDRVRRWFQKHHGMTFQAYLRTLRISNAFGRIRHGDKVVDAAFDSGYESLSGFTESFKRATGFAPTHSPNGGLVAMTRVQTPLGPMLAGAVPDGICLLEFVDRRMVETQLQRLGRRLRAELVPGASPHFDALQRQLDEYFAGGRRRFELPLALAGTPFQRRVWAALQEIPYGTTRSYAEQAAAIGAPRAVRAVARANGDNPVALIVPCHRVIGRDGTLVGYGGGLWRKRYLLDLEAGRRRGAAEARREVRRGARP
jgi:AraC family transcriptional regulator of adaptative response/methylated-DNA-[protein]-cysteine methyltransferase